MTGKDLIKLSENPGLGLDLVRVYLGIGLFVRGVMFIAHPEVLSDYVRASQQWLLPITITHYVVSAHILGGILLAIGLVTRFAALVQIPALLGALVFVHYGEGLLSAGQSLELVGLVLALLVVFSIFGASVFSLDHVLRRKQQELETDTHNIPAHH